MFEQKEAPQTLKKLPDYLFVQEFKYFCTRNMP